MGKKWRQSEDLAFMSFLCVRCFEAACPERASEKQCNSCPDEPNRYHSVLAAGFHKREECNVMQLFTSRSSSNQVRAGMSEAKIYLGNLSYDTGER